VVAETAAVEEVAADTAVGAAARAAIMTRGTQIANATFLRTRLVNTEVTLRTARILDPYRIGIP